MSRLNLGATTVDLRFGGTLSGRRGSGGPPLSTASSDAGVAASQTGDLQLPRGLVQTRAHSCSGDVVASACSRSHCRFGCSSIRLTAPKAGAHRGQAMQDGIEFVLRHELRCYKTHRIPRL